MAYKDPEKQKAAVRRYFATPKGREALRRALRKSSAKRHRRLFSEFLEVYGQVCCCCGETVREFLTVAHLNRDGAAHRKRVGRGQEPVIKDLKNRGWPKDEGIGTQCANCNMATKNGNECPHRKA